MGTSLATQFDAVRLLPAPVLMALALLRVTLAAAVAVSLSPEASVPLAVLVTRFSNHHTLVLFGSSAAVFAVSRRVSRTLEQ